MTDGETILSVIPERDRDAGTDYKLESARVLVTYHDNFTVAVIMSEGEGIVTGVSKRNPHYDPPDTVRGVRLALIRAYRELRKYGWGYPGEGDAGILWKEVLRV
jgi:hypothetical protein